jgi:predicted metalloprotease
MYSCCAVPLLVGSLVAGCSSSGSAIDVPSSKPVGLAVEASLALTEPPPGPLPGQEAGPGESVTSGANIDNIEYTINDFMTHVLRDVDSYWSEVWMAAGYAEPHVDYAFPAQGESVQNPCSETQQSNADTAVYCSLNDAIIISQDLAVRVWQGLVRSNDDPQSGQSSGDFSVAYTVAHEYAHSLQAELGLIPRSESEARLYPTYQTELHADCWAGVWANSAYYRGLLEPGDVEEAIEAANLLGDYAFADPLHHGTPAERRQAFIDGYNSGAPQSCDTYLE